MFRETAACEMPKSTAASVNVPASTIPTRQRRCRAYAWHQCVLLRMANVGCEQDLRGALGTGQVLRPAAIS